MVDHSVSPFVSQRSANFSQGFLQLVQMISSMILSWSTVQVILFEDRVRMAGCNSRLQILCFMVWEACLAGIQSACNCFSQYCFEGEAVKFSWLSVQHNSQTWKSHINVYRQIYIPTVQDRYSSYSLTFKAPERTRNTVLVYIAS